MSDFQDPETSLAIQTFFKSPVLTLLESLEDLDADHVSMHDLLEAYAVLSNRIKITAHLLIEIDAEHPALNFLGQHSRSVAECLHRDVRRAFAEPLPQSSNQDAAIPTSFDLLPEEASLNLEKQVVDMSAVCHAALVVVSNIFRFKALSALFPGKCAVISETILIAHV